MAEREGVIRFALTRCDGPLPAAPELAHLVAWHTLFRRLRLLGQTACRFDGLAFGNLSVRAAGPTR